MVGSKLGFSLSFSRVFKFLLKVFLRTSGKWNRLTDEEKKYFDFFVNASISLFFILIYNKLTVFTLVAA
jgi:hypothetical protein